MSITKIYPTTRNGEQVKFYHCVPGTSLETGIGKGDRTVLISEFGQVLAIPAGGRIEIGPDPAGYRNSQ